MKNFEKYYNELLCQTTCEDCICYHNKVIMKNDCCLDKCSECNENFIKWLNEEYVKNIQLTEDEIVILKNISKEFIYITRSSSGALYIHPGAVRKGNSIWLSIDSNCHVGRRLWGFDHLFKFIEWEDEEPYSIKDLLKEETI